MNAAASVLGSVLAMVIAIQFGLTYFGLRSGCLLVRAVADPTLPGRATA
jgi:hypothetical protein